MIVSFSGIDGSGKSTFATELAARLQARGVPARVARPEYHTCIAIEAFCEAEFGDKNDFERCLDPQIYLHALVADWLEYQTKTLRHHHDTVLVCDRYIHDALAQCVHYRADLGPALEVLRFFPTPDLAFFLEVTPELGHERVHRREGGRTKRLESVDHLRILAHAYEQIMDRLRWAPRRLPSTPEALDACLALVVAHGVAAPARGEQP